MKLTIALVLGLIMGFAGANYCFDAQKIYIMGLEDGGRQQRQAAVFVYNTSYQKGWEDCLQAHHIKKKVKAVRKVKVTAK